MIPDCAICEFKMKGDQGVLRCRKNGLRCTPANADGCRNFEPEQTDEAPWFKNGWDCHQGRGG